MQKPARIRGEITFRVSPSSGTDDKKTDVIIAGKCLAAKDSYSVNAVYANIGDKFKTTSTANQLLENFTSVKKISDFVKKNQNNFFSGK